MNVRAKRLVFPLLGLFLAAGGAVPAMAGTSNFTKVVRENRPAVVHIATTETVKADAPGSGGNPLRQFFRHRGSAPRHRRALGSGFIISPDGHILTNAHVVAGADKIVVKLHDHRQFEARVIGLDKPSDVALLDIDANNLPTVHVGDSKQLAVGQPVMALGSPFGLDYTATEGIVSALHRKLPNSTYTSFIQTDVAVNPGNSGGPLFDEDGEVVGINSQIYSRSGGYMGLSFAVPIDTAMNAVKQIQAHGSVRRGFLGVTIQPVNRDLARSFGLDKPMGALVADVVPNSPAERSGLKAGDIILRFAGHRIVDAADLPPLVGDTAAGHDAKVTVLRNGQRKTFDVKPAARSDDRKTASASQASGGSANSNGDLDAAVRALTPAQRKAHDLHGRGLLVENVAPGPLARAGVRSGDILLSLAGHPLKQVAQLDDIVGQLPHGKPVPLRMRRDQRALFVTLKLPAKS